LTSDDGYWHLKDKLSLEVQLSNLNIGVNSFANGIDRGDVASVQGCLTDARQRLAYLSFLFIVYCRTNINYYQLKIVFQTFKIFTCGDKGKLNLDNSTKRRRKLPSYNRIL
jgi:hypothetical protein